MVDQPLTDEPYEPYDQDKRLPPPPWKPDNPALVAWEAAHGHDVRTKCYPEFGCLVIEGALERQIERLQVERDSLAAELSVLRPSLRTAKQRIDKALARIDRAEPRQWRRVAVMRDIRAALTGTETTSA